MLRQPAPVTSMRDAADALFDGATASVNPKE
jgi:hypothetical protein